MLVVLGSYGDGGHRLEAVLTGRESRGAGPKVQELLPFDGAHAVHDGPKPSLEFQQLVG